MERSDFLRDYVDALERGTAALFVGCVAFAAARNNDKAGLIAFERSARH